MAPRRKLARYHEGPESAVQFDAAMGRILQVSREELHKREAEYTESRRNKTKPGPKPRRPTGT